MTYIYIRIAPLHSATIFFIKKVTTPKDSALAPGQPYLEETGSDVTLKWNAREEDVVYELQAFAEGVNLQGMPIMICSLRKNPP